MIKKIKHTWARDQIQEMRETHGLRLAQVRSMALKEAIESAITRAQDIDDIKSILLTMLEHQQFNH
jgi:hypothetical protein